MASCPNFECLDFSMSNCEKYPACEGCDKLYACSSCSNQASLINGRSLPCDMIHLPEHCRSCIKRQQSGFSQAESCSACAVKRSNDPPSAAASH